MSDKVIHIKKFDGGRSTPDEMHRKLAFGKKRCTGCGGPPAVHIKVLMTANDLCNSRPDIASAIAAMTENKMLPTIPTTYGPCVMISDNVFCDHCHVQAERDAAHPPKGWENKLIVEIDRMGLSSTHKTQVQSAGTT